MIRSTLTACAALALAGTASADMIDISGDVFGSTGMTGATFMGTLEYTYNGGDSGTLAVSLTNDTPMDVGGYLTGFVFNVDSVDAVAALSSTTDPDFLNTGVENAAPFGMFDAGAALNADWTGGGNPSFGMAIGVTEMFEFSVMASDANLLTASSFLGDGNDFVVRFRGLLDGGSDKVPVPAPGAGALALVGLALAGRRRR